MRTVKTLLDECITFCGSQSALSRRLGITPGDVNDMAKGRRPISPTCVGLLCDLLELDGTEAQRLAAEAIVNCAKEKQRGTLRRAFFACSVTGAICGAVTLTPLGAPSSTLAAMTGAAQATGESTDGLHNPDCWRVAQSIHCRVLTTFRRWLEAFAWMGFAAV